MTLPLYILPCTFTETDYASQAKHGCNFSFEKSGDLSSNNTGRLYDRRSG